MIELLLQLGISQAHALPWHGTTKQWVGVEGMECLIGDGDGGWGLLGEGV